MKGNLNNKPLMIKNRYSLISIYQLIFNLLRYKFGITYPDCFEGFIYIYVF